ncbi:hypothetical protein BHE74_00054225 [Ensete ventricosum]|nr:hypothetical protein BHE74_00054225 [Ensete ventricosum]
MGIIFSSTARSFSAFFCIVRATERNSSTSHFFLSVTSKLTFSRWSSSSGPPLSREPRPHHIGPSPTSQSSYWPGL